MDRWRFAYYLFNVSVSTCYVIDNCFHAFKVNSKVRSCMMLPFRDLYDCGRTLVFFKFAKAVFYFDPD